MDIKKRKVGFNYIVFDTQNSTYDVTEEVQRIIQFASSLDRPDRKLDLTHRKFCILESANLTKDNVYHKLIFKSAMHSYRAPLLDRDTTVERDNPKTLNEGESQKCHFIIKYKGGDAMVIAEKFRGGLAMLELINYLNRYRRLYETEKQESLEYTFAHEIVIKDNIDEELDKLSRVQNTQIYVDKQLLGGEALNFSERLETVQESIIIDVRATRKKSIKETTKDILAIFNGGAREMNKIRIKGKNSSNNDVIIDTAFIEKVEHVDAQLNN